jgi:hypothetical protein
MRYFTIFINGEPPVEVANKFWVEISRYDVNFLVLAGECIIFGEATEKDIEELLEKAKSLGFGAQLERGY